MQDFVSKRNAIFACLDDASKELKGTQLDQSGMDTNTINILKRGATGNIDSVYRHESGNSVRFEQRNPNVGDSSLSRMRGKESIFKKPELPIGKCLKPRKTPDYQVNPHKWKKYSLSDVDISDQTNNSAAFAFLKEIDDRQEAESKSDECVSAGSCKVEFKKSSKIKRHLKALGSGEVPDEEVDKPKLKGSKYVMPEYVIGQRPDKKKKQPVAGIKLQNTPSGKQLTLSHLQEFIDDEETEELVDNKLI